MTQVAQNLMVYSFPNPKRVHQLGLGTYAATGRADHVD
jgi:hypothetical protein